MPREINLINYLPQSVKEYREMQYIVNTENPEFQLGVDTAEKIKNASFILYVDKDYISRFERMLSITPSDDDIIESRRARILTRWNDSIPYTMKTLEDKLKLICEDGNFTVTKDFANYKINIEIELPLVGQVEELERILLRIIPANMVVTVQNKLIRDVDNCMYQGTPIVSSKRYTIEQEEVE